MDLTKDPSSPNAMLGGITHEEGRLGTVPGMPDRTGAQRFCGHALAMTYPMGTVLASGHATSKPAEMTVDEKLYFTTMRSPLGELTLVGGDRGLAGVLWKNDRPDRVRLIVEGRNDVHPTLRQTRSELEEFFAGERKRFDVPLDFHGTDFQKSVWAQLVAIPFGETRTYGALAANLGDKNKMRAVGAANGRNPIAIVAPCHRVIGASGDLTGFAGGLDAKRYLLDLESGTIRMPQIDR